MWKSFKNSSINLQILMISIQPKEQISDKSIIEWKE